MKNFFFDRIFLHAVQIVTLSLVFVGLSVALQTILGLFPPTTMLGIVGALIFSSLMLCVMAGLGIIFDVGRDNS